MKIPEIPPSQPILLGVEQERGGRITFLGRVTVGGGPHDKAIRTIVGLAMAKMVLAPGREFSISAHLLQDGGVTVLIKDPKTGAFVAEKTFTREEVEKHVGLGLKQLLATYRERTPTLKSPTTPPKKTLYAPSSKVDVRIAGKTAHAAAPILLHNEKALRQESKEAATAHNQQKIDETHEKTLRRRNRDAKELDLREDEDIKWRSKKDDYGQEETRDN